MRNIMIFSVLFLFLGLNKSWSQVPNGSFENWTDSVYYESPDSFGCNLAQCFTQLGVLNVIKATDSYSGNFALRLVTQGYTGNTIPGGLFLGQASSGGINGGIPFNERPDSVKGYVKYNIMPGDSAIFYVLFKKNINVIGHSFVVFTGTQSDYIQLETQVTWQVPLPVVPDTMALVMLSSKPSSALNPGDTLTIDDISLVGSVLQFPNHDFEYWNPVSSDEPDSWLTSNVIEAPGAAPSVTKSTDAYDGQYAIRLENVLIDGSPMSFITNGLLGSNGPQNGMPVNQNPDKLSFYYKYIPVGADSATVLFASYHWDNVGDSAAAIETNELRLPPAADYTYFEITANYDTLPFADTVNIAFSAGNVDVDSAFIGVGSILLIDKVQLSFKQFNGIPGLPVLPKVYLFPNPASDQVYIALQNGNNGPCRFRLIDSYGKCVLVENLKDTSIPVSLSGISNGFYFYQVVTGSNYYSGKIGVIR